MDNDVWQAACWLSWEPATSLAVPVPLFVITSSMRSMMAARFSGVDTSISAVEHEMCNFLALRGLEQTHVTNEGLLNTGFPGEKPAFSGPYPVT